MNIYFICHGNICRSPMAESIFAHQVKESGTRHDYTIKSFSTSREEIGNDVHPGTKAVLKEHDVSVIPHRAVQLTKKDADAADLLLIMDQKNARNIKSIAGDANAHKIKFLKDYAEGGDIADPWYTGDFETTYTDIEKSCKALLNTLES